MKGYKQDVTGKLQIRYASLRSVCKACPLRLKCLAAKAHRRDIYRWVHEDVIDRHRERIFTRVLNILGLDRFIAYLAKRHSNWAILLLYAPIAVVGRLQIGRPPLRDKISRLAAAIHPAFNYALSSGWK
jgi:hypothetical protein